jgi:hypothetical protein
LALGQIFALHRFLAATAAAVAAVAVRQVMIHLGVQHQLGQSFLQILEKTIGVERSLGVRAS